VVALSLLLLLLLMRRMKMSDDDDVASAAAGAVCVCDATAMNRPTNQYCTPLPQTIRADGSVRRDTSCDLQPRARAAHLYCSA